MRSRDLESGDIPMAIAYPIAAAVPVSPQAAPVPSFQTDQVQSDEELARRMHHDQLVSLDRLELSIRHGFVRKVMGLLFLEILICMGVVCIFM